MVFIFCITMLIMYPLAGYESPDGMATSQGVLYVCCESSGTVFSFDSTLSERIVITGLDSPEGISITPDGTLLVTEDTPQGRILSVKNGEMEVIASNLPCPEGVACDDDGGIWFTTGGFEAGELFTSLWKVQGGIRERVYSLPSVFSFSDISVASRGMIYVCSESSGVLGSVSVFSFNPVSGEFLPFVQGIPCCEGICLTEGGFPMYLASEEGSVFLVDSCGSAFLVAEVGGTIEDVVLFNGDLVVTQDSSGSILRVAP